MCYCTLFSGSSETDWFSKQDAVKPFPRGSPRAGLEPAPNPESVLHDPTDKKRALGQEISTDTLRNHKEQHKGIGPCASGSFLMSSRLRNGTSLAPPWEREQKSGKQILEGKTTAWLSLVTPSDKTPGFKGGRFTLASRSLTPYTVFFLVDVRAPTRPFQPRVEIPNKLISSTRCVGAGGGGKNPTLNFADSRIRIGKHTCVSKHHSGWCWNTKVWVVFCFF